MGQRADSRKMQWQNNDFAEFVRLDLVSGDQA
jgi:hypothetical protein